MENKRGHTKMDMWLLSVVIISLLPCLDTAELQISPSNNITAGLPSFTLRCTVNPTSGINNLITIELKRRREGENDRVIGTINEGEATPRYAPGFSQPKFTLTGNLPSGPSVSSSYLQLVVSDPQCPDEATYTCVTSGFATGIATSVSDTHNVVVKENPKDLKLSTDPDGDRYEPNTTVNITCTGNLIYETRRWSWQWRDWDSNLWSTYPYPASTKTLSQPGVTCEHTVSSTVSYIVPNSGNGVLLRCFVIGDDAGTSLTTSVLPERPHTDSSTAGFTPDDNGKETRPTSRVSGKIAGMAIGLTFVMVLALSAVAAVVHITCWQKRKIRVSDSETAG